MRVVLGAWGLGAYLADHSEIWKQRFGTHARTPVTLPPMSARFSGMVEPFPFVLAKKVFIDANQYDLLMNGGGDSATLNTDLPEWLREFENSDVLSPIDFRAILARKAGQLVHTAEQLLASDDLAPAAAESRRLWIQFLHAPGAKFLPHLESELRSARSAREWDFKHTLDLRDHPDIARFIPTKRVSMAAVQCGHDVFDVVVMLSIASDLDAVLCDWHMYDPFYSMAIRHAHFNYMSEGGSAAELTNLRWYVPLPKVPNLDQMLDLRDDPFLRSLRDADLAKTVSSLGELGSPEAWRDMRTGVQQRLKGVMLNPYLAQQQRSGRPVLTESLDGRPVMLDPADSLPSAIQVLVKEISVGTIFRNISGSTIVNESLVSESFNKISSKKDDDTAKALIAVAEAIDKSGNAEAGALFDSFNGELQKDKPSDTVLRTLWDGVVQKLPTISNMVGVVEKITALFS